MTHEERRAFWATARDKYPRAPCCGTLIIPLENFRVQYELVFGREWNGFVASKLQPGRR